MKIRQIQTYNLLLWQLFLLLFSSISLFSCKEHKNVAQVVMVEKPAQLNEKAKDIINTTFEDLLNSDGSLLKTLNLKHPSVVQFVYEQNKNNPLWTGDGKWKPEADTLCNFLDSCRYYGLFPTDYSRKRIDSLHQKLVTDTAGNKNNLNASVWAEADILLTSAFVEIIHDLKVGRLMIDSSDRRRDSLLTPLFYADQLPGFKDSGILHFNSLEPKIRGYQAIKKALRPFLKKARFKKFTFVNAKDSLHLKEMTVKRLSEDSIMVNDAYDSILLSSGIKKFQKKKGLKQDGKLTTSLVNYFNSNDAEKFARVAVTLDKFKQLPELPQQYIWVNIPSYYLQLRDSDSVVLTSKVVVGKPKTMTPQLTSAISDMITYPKWTIPESIIEKEILPALQRDAGYLKRKGYSLVDDKGNEVDPYSIKWSRFKKSIPYKVVQGSGDDNALGVLKFNFPNKYSVYLHDTNQRYLFSQSVRSLSHGCVRVQEWLPLATYLLRNDSMASSRAVPVDSLNNWLAMKQKRYIPLRKRVPLFIKYFTCDVKNDRLIFYDDIYGEDRRLIEKFFADK